MILHVILLTNKCVDSIRVIGTMHNIKDLKNQSILSLSSPPPLPFSLRNII